MTTKAKKGVETLVEEIGNLSVVELSELVKALQEKFGVSAAAPVQVVAPQAGGESAQAKADEKTEFDVTMTSCGDKKIQVLKVLRELTGLGLKEAKDTGAAIISSTCPFCQRNLSEANNDYNFDFEVLDLMEIIDKLA